MQNAAVNAPITIVTQPAIVTSFLGKRFLQWQKGHSSDDLAGIDDLGDAGDSSFSIKDGEKRFQDWFPSTR
jgi:hypothetical protein